MCSGKFNLHFHSAGAGPRLARFDIENDDGNARLCILGRLLLGGIGGLRCLRVQGDSKCMVQSVCSCPLPPPCILDRVPHASLNPLGGGCNTIFLDEKRRCSAHTRTSTPALCLCGVCSVCVIIQVPFGCRRDFFNRLDFFILIVSGESMTPSMAAKYRRGTFCLLRIVLPKIIAGCYRRLPEC